MREGIPTGGGEENQEVFVPDMSSPEVLKEIAMQWRVSVVGALRAQSPESEQLLNALIASWEGNVGESVVERVGHIQNIAQLYREAGLHRRAFDALQDAADMAYNEFQDALLLQIEGEMEEVRREAGRI